MPLVLVAWYTCSNNNATTHGHPDRAESGFLFRSESSSGLIFYFQTSGRVFFSSPRSRKPEDAAPGRRTCYCPGLFSCPVRNTHHGGGGSLAADLYICIIYVTRGRGAKSARRCAVDHCVSSILDSNLLQVYYSPRFYLTLTPLALTKRSF